MGLLSDQDTIDRIATTNMTPMEQLLIGIGLGCFTEEEQQTFFELINCGYSKREAATAITESNPKASNIIMDEYITSLFDSYIQQKKQIFFPFKVWQLCAGKNETFRKLYTATFGESQLWGYEKWERKEAMISSRVNLISPVIFRLLPNIKSMTIETQWGRHGAFPFNLLYFLEIISAFKKWKEIKIQVTKTRDVPRWIADVWNSSLSGQIVNAYYNKNLTIMFDKSYSAGMHQEFLIIRRQNNLLQ